MSHKNPAPNDEMIKDRRNPMANDVDPDGMDSETEGDELDASADGDRDEADGTTNDRQARGQRLKH